MKFTSSLKLKLIYVFRINNETHKGCLKIGETTSDNEDIWGLEPNSKVLNKAAKKRIDSYTQTAGIAYNLLYTEVSVYNEKGTLKAFSDSEVHKVLERSGIKKKVFDTKNKANEWFITDLETVRKAIAAVKEGRDSLQSSEVSEGRTPIIFRPEQIDAIEKTIKRFKKENKMLWYAKMRFGKTLSALQVVKEHQFKRTLIITHRPVVDEGWYEDFGKIFYDEPKYFYGSKNKGDSFEALENQHKTKNAKYIYFASMQDLRGSELVGGDFDKNDEIFKTQWDLVIIDEAHEGTQTELGENVLSGLIKENTKGLYLSGTPFNLLDNYKEEEIYTWDYVMEQKAKKEWDELNFGDPNPYASLPKLNIFTYDIGKIVSGYEDEQVAFNFREFFRVDETGNFFHQKDVLSFLNLICKENSQSNYPYSTKAYRDNFRHSLWMLPGVKEARALSAMLQAHSVFGQFKIVNVAGEGDVEESNVDALKKVNDAITDKPHESYTITLSCGRLTTGVSVREWTAVFMLSGTHNTSASAYMQTIFRVQTPATINGRVKEECFVFDFAPDRTLKVIAETAKISAKAGKTTGEDREIIGEFLNFCPIIAVNGSQMKIYNVNAMLEQLKKVYIERVVSNGFEDAYLYNDHLMKLGDLDLEEFDSLKKIIGSTKAMPKSGDIDINKQGFTDEEYEQVEAAKKKRVSERTEEEKKILEEERERKKNRDTAISILRGISIRMPLLIYGADVSDEDKEITIDSFSKLIDDQSWEEFMPKGVTKDTFEKFKKYYEPDVFRSAGRRIRAMAHAADDLTIDQRIERITTIFSTFRNPDKETVLTPWRVVNMHLGDTIGGYVFLDENRKETLAQPKFVSQGEVTENVYSTDAHILEINSKTGLYPLYMTYSIFRRRITEKHTDVEPDSLPIKEQQELWDKTIAENIFVICKTPMAKSITRRTLLGFRKVDRVNTRYFEDLENQITNKADKFARRIKRGATYWKANNNDDMKFNAIVGNPPYQVMDGGAGVSAKPVYNHFVDISKKLNPQYISMITPSRWFAGGKGLDNFRVTMLNDNRISKIVDFVNAKDCFPNTSIGGGINYFLWENTYKGKCNFSNIHDGVKKTNNRYLNEFPILIRYNEAVSIIHKINEKGEEKLSSIVSSRNPFGLASNVRGLEKPFKGCITLFSSDGKSYIKKSIVDGINTSLNYYNVMISKVTSEHAGEPDKSGMFRVLSRTELIKPNEVCTDSYLIVGNFSDKQQTYALFLYLKSKFTRFMLLQAITSINLSKDKFDFVPVQDFTSNSDINWNKSIPEIDKQLYEKYGLTEEEVEFIESMIKPMAE